MWPTLRVRSTSELSLEVAACVLGLAVSRRWLGAPSRVMLRSLSVVWIFLVVARYADVTTRSLYGRDVNLYWDLRHVPNVGAMFSYVAEPWMRAAFVGGCRRGAARRLFRRPDGRWGRSVEPPTGRPLGE